MVTPERGRRLEHQPLSHPSRQHIPRYHSFGKLQQQPDSTKKHESLEAHLHLPAVSIVKQAATDTLFYLSQLISKLQGNWGHNRSAHSDRSCWPGARLCSTLTAAPCADCPSSHCALTPQCKGSSVCMTPGAPHIIHAGNQPPRSPCLTLSRTFSRRPSLIPLLVIAMRES